MIPHKVDSKYSANLSLQGKEASLAVAVNKECLDLPVFSDAISTISTRNCLLGAVSFLFMDL